MPLELTMNNFNETVNQNDHPVLVDFWAVWCGPCRMVAPSMDRLASEYAGKAVIAKVNVDEQRTLAERYGVMSIPTVFVFKGGQVVERVIGARPYEALAAILDKHI